MRKLLALWKRHRALAIQFMKFCTVGLGAFCVDYIFLHIGIDILHFGRYGSALFSFPFAVTVSWLGNRTFTFRGQSKHRAHHEWMRFVAVSTGGIILNRGTYSLVVYFWPLAYQYPIIGLVAGTGAGMFFNFFAARRVVFR